MPLAWIAPSLRRLLWQLPAFALATVALSAQADQIQVVSSGGFAQAYKALAPAFEKASGHTLVSGWGPSMGETKNAIPKRLARGEPIDVVIMVGSALDGLVQQGTLAADSRAVLARSGIGMAVRAGAPKPDISTVEQLIRTLRQARSIAYSDSASGVYLSTVLFPKLGLSEALKDTARMVPAEPVGQVVARGDAEIGFQQVSELAHVPGIDLVGKLPDAVQEITLFSAAVVSGAAHAEAGRQLIRFLASPEAADIIRATGLDAVATATPR
jgi:molybdate transport system substrate-binding protein